MPRLEGPRIRSWEGERSLRSGMLHAVADRISNKQLDVITEVGVFYVTELRVAGKTKG